MNFSIIGSGNIAWFLGNKLVAGRHTCTGVYSRNKEEAKELAEALQCSNHGGISEIKDGISDICFMAVSDIAIERVAAQLSFKETVLVHTAGAVSIDAIKKAAKDCAVLWPVYSIVKESLPGHRDIPCGWEAATHRAKDHLLAIAPTISDHLFEAKYEQRKWLHLAAVMSNNFITHLIGICEKICAENKLPYATLTPIINQTFSRIKSAAITGHKNVQTGPAIRNDRNTIEEHLALLAQHPLWQSIYRDITTSIQALEPGDGGHEG